jgi:MFS family permease
MLGGCLGLVGGAVVTVAAIVASTPALLLLGTGMAGLGFGPGNLGAYRVIMARAGSSDRAGLIAAISIVNYLAFGLPALIAGIATSHFGLHESALVDSVVIALLAAAAGGFLFEGNTRTRAPRAAAPPLELPPGPCTVPPYTQRTTKPTWRKRGRNGTVRRTATYVVASIIVIPSQGSRTTLLPVTRFVATLEFRLWVFHWVRFPDAALSKGSSAHAPITCCSRLRPAHRWRAGRCTPRCGRSRSPMSWWPVNRRCQLCPRPPRVGRSKEHRKSVRSRTDPSLRRDAFTSNPVCGPPPRSSYAARVAAPPPQWLP